MNRLTKTYLDGTYGVADILPCGENSYDFKNLLIKTLGKYEELEEQGLLIKLPCKVGDTVYVYNLDVCDWVMSPKVLTFNLCQSGWFVTLDMGSTDKHPDGEAWCMKLSDFGKTIFLTREEAEKALKELEEI